ncbi:hypothetical protein [Streptomyces sp. NPDC004270]
MSGQRVLQDGVDSVPVRGVGSGAQSNAEGWLSRFGELGGVQVDAQACVAVHNTPALGDHEVVGQAVGELEHGHRGGGVWPALRHPRVELMKQCSGRVRSAIGGPKDQMRPELASLRCRMQRDQAAQPPLLRFHDHRPRRHIKARVGEQVAHVCSRRFPAPDGGILGAAEEVEDRLDVTVFDGSPTHPGTVAGRRL